jgi:hypothetical protein
MVKEILTFIDCVEEWLDKNQPWTIVPAIFWVLFCWPFYLLKFLPRKP